MTTYKDYFGNKKMLSSVFAKLQKPRLSQDLKQGAAWSDTLSGMSQLDALIAVKNQIKQVDFASLKGLEKKVEHVLNLDKSAYKDGKKVAYNYLIKLDNDGDRRDVYVVTYEYYRQLYTAYSHIFKALQSDKGLKLNPETLNLFLARYLNAIFMMLKWRVFNHQPAAAGVWDSVHKIIKTAEELAFMNKRLFLYDFQVKETSVAAILERGFMVDTLHQGHYSAMEVELADRVLKVWSSNPVIANTYKANQYHFSLSLENDKRPERLGAKKPHTDCCYWSTSRLIDLMESYLCAADMRKSVVEFGLDSIASVPTIVRLFKKLRLDWCAEAYSRQRRSEERNKKNRLLNIYYGMDAIHGYLIALQEQYLQKSNTGEFTFELQAAMREINQPLSGEISTIPETENRWMVDESKSGFAIDFGREFPSEAETGMLVCYSEPGYQKTFNIAEIRSVRKLASGAYRAGLKKISQNTAAVHVNRVEAASVAEKVADDGQIKECAVTVFPGLLIDNDALGKLKLLIPLEQFEREATYHIAVGDSDYEVKAAKVVSKLNDWVLFEVLPSN